MRRITTGIVGGPILGQLSAFQNNVSGVVTNQDITLSPSGTGIVAIGSHLMVKNTKALQLGDADSTHFVGFKAEDTITTSVTYTIPATGQTNGYVLQTDGSSVLSWASPALDIANQLASTATFYPALLTATSGETTSLNTSSTKLTFQPSTGNMGVGGNLTAVGQVSGTSFQGPSTSVALTATNTTNSTHFPLFASAATGNHSPRTDTGYTYNPSSGELTATIVTASSDGIQKKNIKTINNAMEKVKNLRGVSYNRKSNDSEEIGVIAQEVEKILPSIVRGKEGAKSVAYGNIVAVLIEAIKEQQVQIDDLKARVA